MRRQKGFTLVELISIIVMAGMLYVFAVPRMPDAKAIVALGFQDETLSFLRFAQKSAIAQRRLVCVEFTGNSALLSVSASPETHSCDSPLKGPSGEIPGVIRGKENAAYDIAPLNFNFDGLGRPIDSAGAAMPRQAFHVNGAEHDIVVEPTTGYVHD